jgi:C_GCAxxG_C_C family probable redox protein
MSKIEERARELFANGYNCAQSVFAAFCESRGPELSAAACHNKGSAREAPFFEAGGPDTATALKLANGFGGGLRCGEVCGAVSGAIMALGLKCGFHKEKDFEQKNYCNAKTYEFIQKFNEIKGSILCRDLLGTEIRKPEDHLLPEAREAHKTLCPEIVATAVRVLESLSFDRISY